MSYNFFKNAKYAVEGVFTAIKSEKHVQVHVLWAIVVIVLGNRMHFERLEWMYTAITITTVLVAEIFNTVVEEIIDHLSPDYSIFAKRCKDMAAGAVLITVLHAMYAGYLLFFRRIVNLCLGG